MEGEGIGRSCDPAAPLIDPHLRDPLGPSAPVQRGALSENIRRLGLTGSMDSVDEGCENAPIESFRGSMRIEVLTDRAGRGP